MRPKYDRMANSVNPDQTAPKEQSDQNYTVYSDIYVAICRIFTVFSMAVWIFLRLFISYYVLLGGAQ